MVKLAEDVDFEIVIEMLNNYSGADITAVCRDAALMSMRKAIKGKTPAEIKALHKSDVEKPVTMEDFTTAIERCTMSVQLRDVKRYEQWVKQYGSR